MNQSVQPQGKAVIPTITVNAKNELHDISHTIRGATMVFEPAGSHHFWDWENDRPEPALVARSKEIGLGMLDFPAGSQEAYVWTNAIGPRKQRGTNPGGEWIMGMEPIARERPVNNDFGTDEFCRFCEAVGCDAKILIQFGTSTAQEAAAWVAYVNGDPADNRPIGVDARGTDWKTVGYWAKQRAANGHAAPYGVKYWEVGCEVERRHPRSWASIMESRDGSMQAWDSYYWGTEKLEEGGVWQLDAVPDGTLGNVSRVRGADGCDWSIRASKSDGSANQKKQVLFPPVIERPGSPVLTVDGKEWKRTASLASAGSRDEAYEFDFRTGEIRFGDGKHGAIPPKGAMIKAVYLSGPHDGFIAFSKKMKEVDPTIKLGAEIWDERYIDVFKDHADFFTIQHVYIKTNAADVNGGDIESARMADRVDEKFADIKRKLAAAGAGHVMPALTEYNLVGDMAMSLSDAIFTASLLRSAAEHGAAPMNVWEYVPKLGLPKRNIFHGFHVLDSKDGDHFKRSKALVWELFARHFGNKGLATKVQGAPSILWFDSLDRRDIAFISALASRHTQQPNKLYLMVIMRHRPDNVAVNIRLEGVAVEQAAAVWTLTGKDLTTINDADHPEELSITRSTIENASADFRHTFKGRSVNVVEFTLAR